MAAPPSPAGVVSVWRIATDTPAYTADALSGTGARLTGGRWNARGTPMLYASASRALACLETVVHLGGGVALPLNRYLVRIDIPPALWAARQRFEPEQHVGWDALPAGRVSIAWGSAWAASGASLLAEVPSVIVPEEHNLLINPAHPALGQLRARKLRRWLYDPRALAGGAATPRMPA